MESPGEFIYPLKLTHQYLSILKSNLLFPCIFRSRLGICCLSRGCLKIPDFTDMVRAILCNVIVYRSRFTGKATHSLFTPCRNMTPNYRSLHLGVVHWILYLILSGSWLPDILVLLCCFHSNKKNSKNKLPPLLLLLQELTEFYGYLWIYISSLFVDFLLFWILSRPCWKVFEIDNYYVFPMFFQHIQPWWLQTNIWFMKQ